MPRCPVLLLAVGSITGLLLGVAASKVLASIVYHASASDPVVLLGVAVTMALVGLLSASIPARRALTISPMDLLREYQPVFLFPITHSQ